MRTLRRLVESVQARLRKEKRLPLRQYGQYALVMFKQYLEEIHASLGYFGTWFPNVPLELGAIGLIDTDGRFRPATTLTAILGPQPVIKGEGRGPMKHHSKKGVSVTFKLAGSAPIPNCPLTIDEAGVAVELTEENAILFEASGVTVDRFSDVESIGSDLVARADAKLWNHDYIIITELVHAQTATVLMSKASDARFDATVRADAKLGGAISLADASLGLASKRVRSLGIEVTAEKSLTPLFTAWRVRDRWLSGGKWEPAKSALEGPLEKLSVSDLLEASSRGPG
jgi:hypothetical protein